MQTRRGFLKRAGVLIGALSAHDAFGAQRTTLDAASDVLGADAIHALQFTGSGATFTVGQNFTPSDPWPRVALKNCDVAIDYRAAGMRQELVREMGAVMPRGGGVPFIGERRQIQMLSGAYAWDVPDPADPAAGSLPAACCTLPEAGGTAPVAAPAPGSHALCLLMLWATPHGFIKAARANGARLEQLDSSTEVSFVIAANTQ